MSRAAVLCTALLLGCTSCAQGLVRSRNVDAPVVAEWTELTPGEASLTESLDMLGAPHLVWALPRDGVGMAYRWVDELGWSVTGQWNYLSYQFEQEDLDVPALVLRFDADLVLVSAQEGRMSDVIGEVRDLAIRLRRRRRF